MLEEDPEEDFFDPCLEEGCVELGVVEVGVDVCPAPAPVPELGDVATSITCAGVVAALAGEKLERPISTPTPIESSSTPTPAITAVVFPDCEGCTAAAATGDGPAASGAAAGCLEERRARRSLASALPMRGLRVPHSRQ